MSAKKSKGNTLFSYFSKSDTPTKTTDQVLSQKKSPNTAEIKNRSGDGHSITNNNNVDKQSAKNTPKSKPSKNIAVPPNGGFEVYDVVWAKLEGYPWWPSLVCHHPTVGNFYKAGKAPEIHVQFFDDPISRAWIKLRNVRPYKGSSDVECQRGGTFYIVNTSILESGLKQGDEALAMERSERCQLVVELQPSSDEDEEEEEEGMDVDPDDAHMSDDGNDGKENQEEQDRKTPDKTAVKRSVRPERSVKSQKKRRRIMTSGDSEEESGDEFKPTSDESEDDSGSSGVDEDDVSDEPGSEPESPIKAQKRKRETKSAISKKKKTDTKLTNITDGCNKSSFSPQVSVSTKSKLSMFSAPDVTSQSTSQNFPHLNYDFLQPENIKDIEGRKKSHPDYNPRTLHVPNDFLKKQTPAMRQWWELKSQYFDTVLFFKMGKFYELFHMDSELAVNELGLIYMKGDHAHSGFPEIAYSRYSESLVAKGYKVGRCEQTETPVMMADRCRKMSGGATKFDKVVKREMCQISSPGTKTYQHSDGDCTSSDSFYLLAIAEKATNNECSTYGVCFVDTSIGIFHVGQFQDDRHNSRLQTLLAFYPPSEVLYARGKLSQHSLSLIETNLPSTPKVTLASGTEFWDSEKTLKMLAEGDYFRQGEELEWPETLKAMFAEDGIGTSAGEDFDLGVSALGAVTWYLQHCLIDGDLLSMKKFQVYHPLDQQVSGRGSLSWCEQKHMVMDGITLTNLDVTETSLSGEEQGTLLHRLNKCLTPFGKRLFRSWLCSPLFQTAAIEDRLDAVEDLMAARDVVEHLTKILKSLPDLQKLLSRLHMLGSSSRSQHHPDSRAILYEELTYSKRKIEDFLTTLRAFEAARQIVSLCENSEFRSQILKKSVTLKKDGGHFPDIGESLKFFEAAFDHEKARREGVITPSKGVDADFDRAVTDILSIEDDLNSYLDSQRKELSCRAVVYWGTGKNRYQLEVPESAVARVPHQYELWSARKGWKRYRTAEINKMLEGLTDAELRKDTALKGVMRRLFHSFDERHKLWSGVVECVSVLDVLVSMADYSSSDSVMCRPRFVQPGEDIQPFLEIHGSRHPCITRTFGGTDFIPNDVVIGRKRVSEDEGDSSGQVVVVTGPNMGGKSTLMRQVGLITVIAQMGCYVPAEKCCLTPVDRIFTRLGASDRIMAGESTFFVELSEMSAILQHATRHSLVLVDELGRGTTTYDGTAVACSVVEEISTNISCRTLFSTHYHSLVEQFTTDRNVRLGHMACMVENESEDPSQETITFLYKFVKGACPKSYGFNVARLACLPEHVIKNGIKKAKEFEESTKKIQEFRSQWRRQSEKD